MDKKKADATRSYTLPQRQSLSAMVQLLREINSSLKEIAKEIRDRPVYDGSQN